MADKTSSHGIDATGGTFAVTNFVADAICCHKDAEFQPIGS